MRKNVKSLLKNVSKAPGKITKIMEHEKIHIHNLDDPLQKLFMTTFSVLLEFAGMAQEVLNEEDSHHV